jgi:hypothetical protein
MLRRPIAMRLSGRPSETALFADALVVYGRVQAEHPDIAVMGRSLDSGVAVFVANELGGTGQGVCAGAGAGTSGSGRGAQHAGPIARVSRISAGVSDDAARGKRVP